MNTREKRTQTEPGLGQASGDARSTQTREKQRSTRPPEPTSSPPASAPGRMTKAIEARRPSKTETPMPRPSESSRALARDEEGGASTMEDTPFDRLERKTGETPRSPAVASTPPASRRSQRPIEGRPLSSKPPRARSSMPPSSGRGGRSSVRPPASKPPAKSQRASIRVDDVGAVGADALVGASRQVPRLLKSKDEIASAPIDSRAGFLLAYIDGATSVQGLIDMGVVPEQEVHEILDRLRRLGIIALK